MYLLILDDQIFILNTDFDLHPTMYLLIHCMNPNKYMRLPYLHPTMYLLIRYIRHTPLYHEKYLHPTMYLLIRYFDFVFIQVLILFTSHYVSINSHFEQCKYVNLLHLHPTMYLLIPVIIKASLFLNSEALFCLPFKSANRLLILYALNMPEA